MLVYKVVQLRDGELASHTFYKDSGVIYKIGEATKPRVPSSPLMAFNSVEAAGDWLDGLINITQHKIFEGEYVPFTFDVCMLLAASDMHRTTFEQYWANLRKLDGSKVVSAPAGTVFCSSITLMREITIEELEEAGLIVETRTYTQIMEARDAKNHK